MTVWLKLFLAGVGAGAISLVLLSAGARDTHSNALLYFSILTNVVAGPLFLIGLVGYIVTAKNRSKAA